LTGSGDFDVLTRSLATKCFDRDGNDCCREA
jgi:hypothetical protein